MKLFIIAALVVIMHVSNIKAEYFTRLYFTNADCAGFHVAFDSRNVNSTVRALANLIIFGVLKSIAKSPPAPVDAPSGMPAGFT